MLKECSLRKNQCVKAYILANPEPFKTLLEEVLGHYVKETWDGAEWCFNLDGVNYYVAISTRYAAHGSVYTDRPWKVIGEAELADKLAREKKEVPFYERDRFFRKS